MVAPCKDCTERQMGCHSTCPKYKQYQEWNEERKAIVAANKAPILSEYDFSFNPGKRHRYRRR